MNVHGPMEWRLRGEDLFYLPVGISMAFFERRSPFLWVAGFWDWEARLVCWGGDSLKQSFTSARKNIYKLKDREGKLSKFIFANNGKLKFDVLLN